MDLAAEYQSLTDAYDRAGLPVERVLIRLSDIRTLQSQAQRDEANSAAAVAQTLAHRYQMPFLESDSVAIIAGNATSRP